MDWKADWKKLVAGVAVFAACFYLPVESPRFASAVTEALGLAKWYAREHVLLCLVPAFFIAGAIAVFVSKGSVIKYLGAGAPRVVAYTVAAVSGTILAVCSCTILPLFAGIWRMGAGLGPATAFLYAGPAINVLAIVLTARVLGAELGLARAVGAIAFSIVIGLVMHVIYRKEERQRAEAEMAVPDDAGDRPGWQNLIYFAAMIGILVFANWGHPDQAGSLTHHIWVWKWVIAATFAVTLSVVLVRYFGVSLWKMIAVVAATLVSWLVTEAWLGAGSAASPPGHGLPVHAMVPFVVAVVGLSLVLDRQGGAPREWLGQSWFLAKQMMPLLLMGVLVAGFLLGRPGTDGMVPQSWVAGCVGGNSLGANLFASVAGAFMYFATLTEVPILQGLLESGMGKGPALALLLAGPALSLPNMLVIRSVMGTQKTVVFVCLVVVMSTISGIVYGNFFG